MTMKKITIQNILLPNQGPQSAHWGLYYQGAENVCEDLGNGKGRVLLSHYKSYNFCSYFNAISIAKWKKYTNIEKIMLRLEMEGEFEVSIEGYHLVAESKQRKVYDKKRFSLDKKSTIELEIPLDNSEMIMGFSVKTFSDSCCYGGQYVAEIDENSVRNIHLSIATTTFQKEEYIKKNVEMFKTKIIANEELKSHFSMHVVDNGRTLSKDEIESEGVYLHPNKNVGGAGGFARGMMESLKEDNPVTHVLLMDDDVLILPESLLRTYYLLAFAKEEYKNHVISGAMLYLERMAWFHEDAGFMGDGVHHPLKHPADMRSITRMLVNENINTEVKDGYAAWWYCCIPVQLIKSNGLPLPLFIRGDDIEFGVRNQIKTITMNGICLWHMGFATKYSASMNYYQSFRNAMIMNACDECGKAEGIIAHYEDRFREELHRFNYNAAELILRAWNDYMKGPSFIEKTEGEKIMKERGTLNAKLKDLTELGISINPNDIYNYEDCGFIQKVFYKLSDNGQKFCLKRWNNQDPAILPYDEFFNPGRQAFKNKVVSVNIHTMQGEVRVKDRKRYKELMTMYKKTKKRYKKNGDQVCAAYRARKAYMTSDEFWNKYLEIEQYQQ